MSSEFSGQCELCLNQSNQIFIRVFPCLYHCKKMLCIQHLSEHDEYIEKQIQFKQELENLWKNYNLIFNEDKLENELEKLKIKLENYRQLKQEINHLLLINHFHNSIEDNQKFQIAIQTIQKAIEHENIHDINPKIELILNEEEEENPPTIDYRSLSSSVTTNDESETMDSLPSLFHANANSPSEDEYHQHIDEFDDHENSIEMDNEDENLPKDETNVTLNRSIIPSKIRDYCPLTRDGVFGINSHLHGIRLCPNKSRETQRTYLLNEHFRRLHHLTPFASLALARAVGSGQDPTTTRLFSDHHVILNIDELRTVNCPITKPFSHYPLLSIENSPCHTIKQVRHLKDHLKRIHKFTNKAANIIIKSVKNDTPIQMIQFPQWIEIIEKDNYI